MKMETNMKILFLSAFVLFLAANLSAQDFKEAELPQTPAAARFKSFLEAIETGQHEEFLRENCSDEFLSAFPMSQHLDFFRQVTMFHGGFKVHSIVEASETKLVVLAQSNKGKWRKIDIVTASEAPYRVIGLGLDEASSPAPKEHSRKMTEKEILSFVENKLQDMSKKDEFSGSVLIASNGRPLYRKAFGMANKSFEVLNAPDTKFNIGSINKSFTELAIAQLWEQGKLKFEDKIGDYLPGFPREIAEKVTVQHLLTMRSGMGSYWNNEYWSKFSSIKTIADLLEIIKDQPIDFEPGTSRQYSNSGFVVLGAIIEKISGLDYYDYVRKYIFEPAGMTNTDSYELDQIVPNLAVGYTRNRSESARKMNKYQNNLFIHGVKGSPAGGGYSTVDDLLNYVTALQENRLAGRQATNLVLGLFQNINEPDNRPKGLGIAGGAPVGINAIVEADFEAGYTVIVLSNYDPPTAEDLGLKIMEMLAP